MSYIKIKSHAKINLTLSVNKKLKNGLHDIQTLFCLINLFEFPILFYGICVVLYVSGKVDAYFILLAYWFVGLRVAHSLYHIFINGFIGDMPLRALLWLPSWIIVIWMWVRFISLI